MRRPFTNRTLRRAAALSELASLGCWVAKAADYIGIDPVSARRIGKAFAISYPRRPRHQTPLYRSIRRYHAQGMKPQQIAERVGTTGQAVRVLLYRIRNDKR